MNEREQAVKTLRDLAREMQCRQRKAEEAVREASIRRDIYSELWATLELEADKLERDQ